MSRTLPNLGLIGGYAAGDDGWEDDQNTNLLKLSVLVQGVALDFVSSTPVAPSEGDVYAFLEDHPTNANDVAIYDDGMWKFLTPSNGWVLYNLATGIYMRFTTAWFERDDSRHVLDAPASGGTFNVPNSDAMNIEVYFMNSATLAAYTVNLPTLKDGQTFKLYGRGAITAFTMNPSGGQNWAVVQTSLPANFRASWKNCEPGPRVFRNT